MSQLPWIVKKHGLSVGEPGREVSFDPRMVSVNKFVSDPIP
jgi:hypothetical protein